MGVRFSGTFKPWIDDFGLAEIEVKINDNFGGGNLPIRVISVKTFTETEAREPLAVINAARVEVTFLIEDDSYASFIDDLSEMVADRFFVTLENLNYIFFAGAVVHDFTDYEDAAYPYSFTVNAQDGLVRMKDIDYLDENGDPYNDVSPHGPYISAMDHIINCFKKLNLDNIYGTTFDLKRIWVHCDWYATNMGNPSANPLEQLYIHGDVFYDHDNEGNIVADKCYNVLEAILTAMGLSITYGRGIYRIDQYSQRQPDSATYFTYNFDGASSGTRAQSWKSTIDKERVYPKATGTFSMLPPLRQVKVKYTYSLNDTAVEPDEVYGFGGQFTGGGSTGTQVCYLWQVPSFNAGNLRELGKYNIDESQLPLRFRVNFQLMISTTFDHYPPSDWVNHKFLVRVWLRIDTGQGSQNMVAQRWIDPTGYNRFMYGEEQWVPAGLSTNSISFGGWDFLTEPFPTSGNSPTTKYLDLGFETQDFPVDPVYIIIPYICVGIQEIITENGAPLSSEYTHEWAISDLNVIYGKSSNKAKPTESTVEVTSKINLGGTDEKTIEVKIGDRGNSIKVENGGDLKEPGGWGVGGGGDKELAQLLADEYHSIRGKPIRLTTRTIIGRQNLAIDSLMAFYYCDLYWLALQTEHDFDRQEITGTWWNHTGNFTTPAGSTSTLGSIDRKYNRLDERDDLSALPARAESRGRDGNGFTAPTTKFLIDTDNFVLPLKVDYDADAINKIVDVFINGDKLEYIETIPASQGNTWYTIDNTDNSIVVSDNFPLSARHWIQVFKNG